jgi:hypothetical protein
MLGCLFDNLHIVIIVAPVLLDGILGDAPDCRCRRRLILSDIERLKYDNINNITFKLRYKSTLALKKSDLQWVTCNVTTSVLRHVVKHRYSV